MNRPEFDNLTKLYTEAHLNSCIDQELLRARRYERPLCLLYLSVEVPEEYRRDMHYRVLKQLGGFVKMYTRSIDVGGRTKEGVTVLLPETPIDGSIVVAGKIKTQLENHVFIHPDLDEKFTVKLAYKITAYPQHGQERKDLTEFLNKYAPSNSTDVNEIIAGVSEEEKE